jgi:hypothetical protein
MAMYGVPVITSGQTHYRGRGFTQDPDSWVSYFKLLGTILSKPSAYRLTRAQVESAWEYAYRFFFEYPHPFPWHLVRVWDDYKARPLSAVCSPEGQQHYGATFKYLIGDPIDWHAILQADGKRHSDAQHFEPQSALHQAGAVPAANTPSASITATPLGAPSGAPSDTPSGTPAGSEPQVGIPRTGKMPESARRASAVAARAAASKRKAQNLKSADTQETGGK